MIIAHTIGHTTSYEQCLKSSPDRAYKMGQHEDYEGGWIWKTAEEAEIFINSPAFLKVNWGDGKSRDPKDFSVFKVELVNGWDDVSAIPGEDGVYNLLVDSKFSK